jgi:hypothetical protein
MPIRDALVFSPIAGTGGRRGAGATAGPKDPLDRSVDFPERRQFGAFSVIVITNSTGSPNCGPVEELVKEARMLVKAAFVALAIDNSICYWQDALPWGRSSH